MDFYDKRGRKICLKDDCDTIYAYHKNDDDIIEVGYIQFAVMNYLNDSVLATPEIMHIKENYKRSGIATKIIEYAKEQLYDKIRFAPDTGCGGKTDEIYYSDEGLQFKIYCESRGITKEKSI